MKTFHINKEAFNTIQSHIIKQFGQKNRFAVVGGPGTGKTLLALEGFNQVLRDEADKQVAFIVYNRALRAFLKRYLNYSGKEDVIFTWHSWLTRFLMRTFDIDFEEMKKAYQPKPYTFDFDKIEHDLNEIDDIKKYYYIFVDEAQDIPDALLRILDKVSIKFFVFLDDNQKFTPELLESNPPFSTIEQATTLHTLALEEDFYDLTQNFRNTKGIESVAKLFDFNYMINNITLRRNTVFKEGPKPRLIDVSNIDVLVEYVISEHDKYPQKSIALLMPKIANHKALLDTYRDAFLKHPKINKKNFYVHSSENEASLNTHGIFLMTYQVAKGLEFDHVYLIELNNPQFKLDFYHKNAFYVSITRAEKELSLVFDNTLKDTEVMIKLKSHHTIFEQVTLKVGDRYDR